MNKEIEKIYKKYEKKLLNIWVTMEGATKPHIVRKKEEKLLNKYSVEIISLFSSKIAECEDEIRDLIYDDETCQADTIAKLIITLIQNKIKE